MFQETFNAISTGARGKFGRQVVIYIRYGRVIIAKAPRKRPGRGTGEQERTRNTFRQGAAWSKKVRKTPLLHAVYKSALHGALNVHNLAISDALQAPVIHDVQMTERGILVNATDNFKVDSVTVSVYRGDKLLETGKATIQEEAAEWLYVPALRDLRGCEIVVTAKDLPGNATTKELAPEGEVEKEHGEIPPVTPSEIVGNGVEFIRNG